MDTNKEKFNELIEYLINGLKEGVDFANEQLPLIAQEIVRLHLIEGGIWVAIGLIGLAASCFLIKWTSKEEKGDDAFAGLVILSTVVSVLSIGSFLAGCHSILEAFLTPRLVILDYLQKLL